MYSNGESIVASRLDFIYLWQDGSFRRTVGACCCSYDKPAGSREADTVKVQISRCRIHTGCQPEGTETNNKHAPRIRP